MSDVSEETWKCALCGFVHNGEGPPDCCPICGAQADQFDSATQENVKPDSSPVKSWVCTICGFVHEGKSPLDECPVCSAPKDAFVAQ